MATNLGGKQQPQHGLDGAHHQPVGGRAGGDQPRPANTYNLFYNDVLLDTKPWGRSEESPAVGAVDLFSNNSSLSFMDNVWLDPTVPVELQDVLGRVASFSVRQGRGSGFIAR